MNASINVDLTKVRDQIEVLKDKLAPYSNADLEQSRRAGDELSGMMQEMISNPELQQDKQSASDLDRLIEAARPHADLLVLERLEATLDLDLIYVPTRYIAADGPLISPSGFRAEDRVFIQPTIALYFDEVPGTLPHVNVPMRIYDLGPVE